MSAKKVVRRKLQNQQIKRKLKKQHKLSNRLSNNRLNSPNRRNRPQFWKSKLRKSFPIRLTLASISTRKACRNWRRTSSNMVFCNLSQSGKFPMQTAGSMNSSSVKGASERQSLPDWKLYRVWFVISMMTRLSTLWCRKILPEAIFDRQKKPPRSKLFWTRGKILRISPNALASPKPLSTAG